MTTARDIVRAAYIDTDLPVDVTTALNSDATTSHILTLGHDRIAMSGDDEVDGFTWTLWSDLSEDGWDEVTTDGAPDADSARAAVTEWLAHMATKIAASPRAHVLAELDTAVALVGDAEEEVARRQVERDGLIQVAREAGMSAIDLAARTGLNVSRIYQILSVKEET